LYGSPTLSPHHNRHYILILLPLLCLPYVAAAPPARLNPLDKASSSITSFLTSALSRGCAPTQEFLGILSIRATGEFLKMKEFLRIPALEFLLEFLRMREKKLYLFLVDAGERIPQECEWVWIYVEEFL
jgi:hypothetical protein